MDSEDEIRDRAKADQSLATIADTWPPALYRFFKNSVKSGFTDDQALLLTVNFLNSVIKRPADA